MRKDFLKGDKDNLKPQDQDVEKVLRPKAIDDFTGQPHIVDNLKIFVKAAKMRGEALDHVLLHGPPGLGKTTLSYIVANELGVNVKVTSGHQPRATRCAVYRRNSSAKHYRRGVFVCRHGRFYH